MGRRRDKGLATARYLVAATGIPGIRWDGVGLLESPWPYVIHLTTSRKLENWHNLIREMPDDDKRINIAIRYDHALPDVSRSWAAMPLRDLTTLLACHYEKERG
jgi:hypothetical protein